MSTHTIELGSLELVALYFSGGVRSRVASATIRYAPSRREEAARDRVATKDSPGANPASATEVTSLPSRVTTDADSVEKPGGPFASPDARMSYARAFDMHSGANPPAVTSTRISAQDPHPGLGHALKWSSAALVPDARVGRISTPGGGQVAVSSCTVVRPSKPGTVATSWRPPP